MQDELRDRFFEYLASSKSATLSGSEGKPWSVPVRYQVAQLTEAKFAIDCTFPSWTEAAFRVSEQTEAVLVVQLEAAEHARWVEIRGQITATTVESNPARTITARLSPTRLDLLDEQRGVRETLEW